MGVVYAAYDPELDRKIAVKLLKPDRAGSGGAAAGRARLLREGRAMARLAHPNVVAVHDVGQHGDSVFVAMELVDGQTLRAWQEAPGRTWRDIRDAYLQGGRALAAAHAIGLVHRDFKPENALVDRGGTVRVLDFGLARAAGEAEEPSPAAPDWEPRGAAALAETITRTGAVLGTPAYMAPEQRRGQADARADQFSFAVALHEALTGRRPEVAGAPPPERPPPPAPSRPVARLLEVLARALREDPDQRYPSMTALLAELARDPDARRRRVLAGVGGGALLAATAVAAWQLRGRAEHGPPPCSDAPAEIAATWGDAARARVRRAFTATGSPLAPDALRAVERALDGFADRWATGHRDACLATNVRRIQSAELLDLRMACLAERRQRLAAVVEVLAAADAAVVEKAVPATQVLGGLADCDDLALLREPVPPPTAPAARARVTALRAELARAIALQGAGRLGPAAETIAPVVAEAHALAYAPLEAEARLVEGSIQREAGRPDDAAASIKAAVLTAEAGRLRRAVAEGAVLMVRVAGFDQRQRDEGHAWAERAAAAVQAAGADPRLDSQLANNLGTLYYAEQAYDDALVQHRRALALREQAFGPDDALVGASRSNIGLVHYARGDYAEAIADQRRAVAIYERAYGAEHPRTASVLDNLGAALLESDQLDEAEAVYRRSLAIKLAAVGPDSPTLATTYNNLGNVHFLQGRWEDALGAHRRALALKEASLGPEHASVASSRTNIANVLRSMGRLAEALAEHERALAIKEQVVPDSSDVAHSLQGLGLTLVGLGRGDEARARFRRAAELFARTAPDHPTVAAALTQAAALELDRGRAAVALADLERALAIRTAQPVDPLDLASTRFHLARALTALGRDPARARALITEARAAMVAAGARADADLAELDAWRRRHPG